MDSNPDDQFDDDLDDSDCLESDSGSFYGVVVVAFLQAAIIGSVMMITAPIWVPSLIISRLRRIGKPKPPEPKYRGTVRPLVPFE